MIDLYNLAKPGLMLKDMSHADRWRWMQTAIEIECERLLSGYLMSNGNWLFKKRENKARRVLEHVREYVRKLDGRKG